jgi:hypothetical protein
MVSFIEEHALNCDVCRQDPVLKEEIAKITELILPESKIPKAVRLRNSEDEEDEDIIESDDDEIDVEDKEEEEEESDDSLDDDVDDEEEFDLDDDI